MLRDVAVARAKQLLGFKKNLDAELVQAMIETQEDLERSSELPFFLRKKFAAFNTVASQQFLNAPADFIREWDEDPFTTTVTDGTDSFIQVIKRDEAGYLKLRYPSTNGTGFPKAYSRTDKVFYFYPIPDAIYNLDGSYYAKGQDLSTNVENSWMRELPHIIIARAGLQVATGLRDQVAMSSFSAMNDIFTAKLHLMTTADDAAGGQPVIGGED